MGHTAGFSCLTAELVDSRSHPDRTALRRQMEATLAELNETFADDLVVPFSITLGDEWQGLVSAPCVALEADFLGRWLLYPHPVAAGLGLGRVSTPPRERTALMDGPCFHRAREAVNRARHRRGSATVLVSGSPLLDDAVNALCLLLHAVAERWTERQFQSLRAYVRHGTEAAAAEALGVSQPTLHQSLDRSQGKIYLEARDALLNLVRRFPGPSENAPAPHS